MLDNQLCEYLEDLWSTGLGRAEAGNVLSAVQFFLRQRHILSGAWSLWSTWKKTEAPWQAPPLPLQVWGAWVESLLQSNKRRLATLIVLGFTAMLR
eukprot:6172462-Amphidinium_carterae.1